MSDGTKKIITGKLEAFYEQGMTGHEWCVFEDGKSGYDALHAIKKGDILIMSAFGAGFSWGAVYLKWAY